jgi:hypothetical protein
MKVTAAGLRKRDACEEQVRIFEKEWPKGVKVTRKALRRAVELGLDLVWFEGEFLSLAGQRTVEDGLIAASNVYQAAVRPPYDAYAKARDQHRASTKLREAWLTACDKADKEWDLDYADVLWKALKV